MLIVVFLLDGVTGTQQELRKLSMDSDGGDEAVGEALDNLRAAVERAGADGADVNRIVLQLLGMVSLLEHTLSLSLFASSSFFLPSSTSRPERGNRRTRQRKQKRKRSATLAGANQQTNRRGRGGRIPELPFFC